MPADQHIDELALPLLFDHLPLQHPPHLSSPADESPQELPASALPQLPLGQ